ncbi:MAG: hypothetical protein KF751_07655 [Nitrospira sp.]|nr:hypothetical protein [Nitrospira sp.]MBX3348962.1 hypothetical protein [Nitrospira sp.]
MFRLLLGVLSLLILSGCGAKLNVSRVPLPYSEPCICGLVVSHMEPHIAYAIFPELPGSKTIQVQSARVMLPSADEAYVIGYRSGLFSSRELTIALNNDGSLQGVKLTGELGAAKALDAIAKNADALAKADKTIRDEADKAKKNPLDVDNDELKREIKNIMLKANKDALENGLPLPYPNAN